MEAKCPYCGAIISPFPKRGKACLVCNKKYRVRTFPFEDTPRIIREEELAELEELWSKKHYIDEAMDEDLGLTDYDKVDTIIVEAKKAFKDKNTDEAWGLYNKAIVQSLNNKYASGSEFLSTEWKIYRPMAIQLIAEEKYINALHSLLRLAILEFSLYSNNSYDFSRAVTPVTLEMIEDVIKWGKIKKEKLLELFNQAFSASESLIKSAKIIEEKSEIAEFFEESNCGVKVVDKELFKEQLLRVLIENKII